MDQKDFLSRVLPAGNHYIAYPGDKRGPSGQIIWNHRSFTEPYQGVAVSDQTASRSKDVYFAVASFKKAKILDPKLGKEKSYRKQENVAELKCLFLDIDFKNYKSPEETVEALKAFLLGSQLEKPTIIVRTGGGLHVYWTFPAPLPRDEWQVLANGLAGVAENLGLRADLQCTIDSARILRMPGTRNFKYDPAPLCEIVSSRPDDVDMEAMGRRLRGVTSMRARTGRGPKPSFTVDPEVTGMFGNSSPDDLGAGVMGESLMSVMATGCPLLADMLAKGGDGYNRPLWNNMLLLASFAPDGREYAHLMSKDDQRYTQSETDREFDAKFAEQGKGIGPTTCDTFAISGSAHCSTCPHRNKIKSPIVLGRVAPKPEVLTPPPPTYNNRYGQTVFPKTMVNADGDEEVVEHVIVNMETVGTPVLNRMPTADSHFLEITFADRQARSYRVALDTARMKNREYLMGQFGARKIGIQRSSEKPTEEAMVAWVNFLRSTGADAPGSFGWMTVNDRRGFAIAGEFYADDGEQYRIGIAPGYDKGFGAAGDPEPWQEMAAMIIADERAEMQIALATAFAAPLVEFTELSSTTVNIRSTKSGVGKTSVMRTARAVYGDPDFMSHASDTPNYVESTLAVQTNMPWYWDELRGTNPEQLRDTIYQILQGKSKGRAAPDGSSKTTMPTRGMLVTASNINLQELMQSVGLGTDAGTYRIFEIDIPPRKNQDANSRFNDAMYQLKGNYGHAGVTYARYLATHKDEVRKVLGHISDEVDKQYVAVQAERFWIATVKTLLAGAFLAKRAGICNFDITRMNQCLKGTVQTARTATREVSTGEELAGNIYQMFQRQLLVTDHYQWVRGRPRLVTVVPTQFGQFGLAALLRLAILDDVLAISTSAITQYAKDNHLQAAIITDQIRQISFDRPRTTVDGGASISPRGRREYVYVMKASDILGVDEMQDWAATWAASHPASSPGSSSATAPSGSTTP